MATAERSRLARVGWTLGEEILPLPLAIYANHRHLAGNSPGDANVIPAGDWVAAEADALLERSDARLESLESKGPGLATLQPDVFRAPARQGRGRYWTLRAGRRPVSLRFR
jgi:hypothetical protein